MALAGGENDESGVSPTQMDSLLCEARLNPFSATRKIVSAQDLRHPRLSPKLPA